MTAIHPDARARFDTLAADLFIGLSSDRPVTDDSSSSTFVPDHDIAGTFTDDDLLGTFRQSQSDADGHEISCLAGTKEGFVAFHGNSHQKLIELTQSIQRTPTMRDSVSPDTIKTWIIDWALARRITGGIEPLMERLLLNRDAAIASYKFLIPLDQPFIEESFSLGSVLFTPLLRDDIEKWFATPSPVREGLPARTEQVFAARRQHLFGRTAAVITLQAERTYAAEIAIEKATLAAALLRLVSKGIFSPTTRSNCVLLGYEIAERQQFIEFKNDEFVGMSESIVAPESIDRWILDRRMIAQDLRYWTLLAELLEAQSPSAFERDLLAAILLYSRVALSREVSEKLIHLFAALESVLLRNESEPIQSAISERLAFVVGRRPEERAQIAQLVKSVYGLRSRFVHHGVASASQKERGAVKELLLHVWKFFFQLTLAKTQYQTRDLFLDDLEKRKWQ